ncbi:unnamed protein product [Closterium sp. NIES-53]
MRCVVVVSWKLELAPAYYQMKCYDTDAAFSPSLVPPAQLPVMPAGATAGYQPALVEMALDPQQQQQQQEEEQGGQEEEQQQHQ